MGFLSVDGDQARVQVPIEEEIGGVHPGGHRPRPARRPAQEWDDPPLRPRPQCRFPQPKG